MSARQWRSGKGSNGGKDAGYFGRGKGVGKDREKGGRWEKGGGAKAGGGGNKPTDDESFVKLSVGTQLGNPSSGSSYLVEAYIASGTFSRVFRVKKLEQVATETQPAATRWRKRQGGAHIGSHFFAAKIARKQDCYLQYAADAPKEGQLLQTLEKAQLDGGKDVLTMRCFDSFPMTDESGNPYWCLILEWLDASLFDVVRANRNQGLHISMVRILLEQLLQQVHVLQAHECTHTDIKHKNCCLVDTEYYLAPAGPGGKPTMILTRPLAKLIDYGNAVFEGEAKGHPIHTKQFRAPEVLLNVAEGWGPPSDMWTLGITAAFLISGNLIFNSHDPSALVRIMVEALGPFPTRLLDSARDVRLRRTAVEAADKAGPPKLAMMLGLAAAGPDTVESHCVDLVQSMLALDPATRITARDALKHPFICRGEPSIPEKPAGAELRTLGQ